MKWLRGLLAGVITLGLAMSMAFAAMNLRQDTDGGASFRFTPGENAYKVGRAIIQGLFSDIATASTVVMQIPQNGRITEVMAVINNAITTANCTLTFRYNDNVTDQINLTITQSGSAAGKAFTSSGNTLQVTKAAILRVISDGSCDTTTITPVTVYIDPFSNE